MPVIPQPFRIEVRRHPIALHGLVSRTQRLPGAGDERVVMGTGAFEPEDAGSEEAVAEVS